MNADRSRKPHVPLLTSRRDFLCRAGGGFGALALACLLRQDGVRADEEPADADPLAPKPPQFQARAKAVIFLFMEGGPSHLDTFDPKPELTRLHGQPLPASLGVPLTPMGLGGANLLASQRTFRKFGESGIEVCDWLPHLASCMDDIAVIRSCWA